MHISGVGVVSRSIHAAYCGVSFAAYNDTGGALILARRSDYSVLFIQPGDDADTLRDALENGCNACGDDEEREIDMIDGILRDYDDLEEWAKGNPMPSSDLMLLNYAR